MATYPEFRRKHRGEKPKILRCYWITGPEAVLREEAVDLIRKWCDVESVEYASMNVTAKTEPDVWDHLDQYGLRPEKRRLLLVRGAERLKNVERLLAWLNDSQLRTSGTPGTTVIFVSAEDEWPQDRKVETRERVLKASTSMYVRCALPKDHNTARASEVIQTWGRISDTEARRLFVRVGRDLGAARSVMRKSEFFPGEIRGKVLDALSPSNPQEDVVEAILGLDKRRALLSAIELDRREIGRVLGTLAAHLDVLSRLEPVAGTRSPLREVASRLGVSETWVRMLIPYVKFYPRKQQVRRALLLDKIDNAWQRGARHGVLEALIAAW